ncbi:protein MARD1-like, partial [Prunus avium]|uniref:Protein MARD1-like n=1 Tax=Prunus avium TaxID=42229 RepID=A0A6P5RJW1_PRUAV
MPGKRLRFVRSSTSFYDLSSLHEPLPLPPPEQQLQMKPPRYPKNVPMEEDDASPPAWSPNMKENGQGQSGNFLDRCNYCRKILGEKDNIYMYSSLRAFCSSQCRHRQIVVDSVRER